MTPRPHLFAAPLLIVAIGCTTFAPRTAADYARGKAPDAKFAKDNEICAKQSEVDQRKFGVGGDLDPTHATYNRMYDACMRASGYQRKQEETK